MKTTLTTRDNSKHKHWRMPQEIFHSQTISVTLTNIFYFIFTPLRNHTTVCSLSLFPRNCCNLNLYKMFIVFYVPSAVAGLLFYKCKLLIKLMRKYISKKNKTFYAFPLLQAWSNNSIYFYIHLCHSNFYIVYSRRALSFKLIMTYFLEQRSQSFI